MRMASFGNLKSGNKDPNQTNPTTCLRALTWAIWQSYCGGEKFRPTVSLRFVWDSDLLCGLLRNLGQSGPPSTLPGILFRCVRTTPPTRDERSGNRPSRPEVSKVPRWVINIFRSVIIPGARYDEPSIMTHGTHSFSAVSDQCAFLLIHHSCSAVSDN